MSDDELQRIEVITGVACRTRWSAEQKLCIVEERFTTGESVSVVARCYGVAPNLLFRWRRLMTEGGATAVSANDELISNAELRKLEDRIRESERQLRRKTLEVEILKEAVAKPRAKKPVFHSTSHKPGGSQ